MAFDKRSSLKAVLEVFAADALAVAGTKDSNLETLAVLLQTTRFLAAATLYMELAVRRRLFFLLSLRLSGRGVSDLGSERLRSSLQSLRNSFLT